jgi:tight adherence protein C
LALAATGLATGTYALARVRPLPRPTLGHRGLQRTRALDEVFGFALVEPGLRWLAAIAGRLPGTELRNALEAELMRAGAFLGLGVDECLALSALGGLAGGMAGQLGRRWLDLGAVWPPCFALLGLCVPWLRVHSESERRRRSISRALPSAIDLLALAMSAGLDFTGAVELLVDELRESRQPLVIELERVLQALAMGTTRSQALLALAERAPCAAICEFVGSVVQAEQKGNPLAEALVIQGRMLRMRRSVAAEEAAARASVLLVLPMMLLLAAVVLLMLGPFLVNGMGL